MSKISIALAGVVLACALSGCTSDQLKGEQQIERQALSAKQQADRQVEHAQETLAVSSAGTAAVTANLAAKKQEQKQADSAMQQLFCPVSEQ
ncbi:hypothetical protein [Lelliottia nimipressuralis]